MGQPDSDLEVGVLARRGRFTVVEPLFEPGRHLKLGGRVGSEAAVGDIVAVSRHRGRGAPTIVRSLGQPEVAHDVIEALLVDRGCARGFPQRVLDEADAAAGSDRAHQRRDLTALTAFTIDPASARDFDDAISIERDGDQLRLYVHIADVATHVTLGSALDREAQRRGNSVYVPGAVEPMLPEALSNNVCSLVPGEPRNTVTAEITLSENGEPMRTSFYRSLIRSDKRLDYEQVDRIFEGEQAAPESVVDELVLARKLAAVLRDSRFKRGALTVETTEPEFEFDQHGHVREARDAAQTEAHWLIEEFMILANEQVASELERRRLPTIYRVHEQPDPESIEFLAKQLDSLDIPTPPIPTQLSRSQATEMVGKVSALVVEYLGSQGRRSSGLTSLVLRSLKQAVYTTNNVGHSGLSSPSYAHFTSPIRRYPDLVVHRSLLAMLGAGELQAPASELEEIAQHCSQTERDATATEHQADDICLAFLLESVLYENGWESVFEGEVTGLTHGAAFVTFGPLPGGAGTEGFLPARKMTADWYDLNELNTALVGRESGTMVRIGDPVSVKVTRIETVRGRVDLEPAEADG